MEQRILKFRVWDTLNSAWLENYTVYQYGNVASNGEWLPNKDVILMQFTGLHDKNGKEIYEGDVVKFQWGVKKLIAPVIYRAPEFDIDADYNEYLNWGEFEIIGNIYENPELI